MDKAKVMQGSFEDFNSEIQRKMYKRQLLRISCSLQQFHKELRHSVDVAERLQNWVAVLMFHFHRHGDRGRVVDAKDPAGDELQRAQED